MSQWHTEILNARFIRETVHFNPAKEGEICYLFPILKTKGKRKNLWKQRVWKPKFWRTYELHEADTGKLSSAGCVVSLARKAEAKWEQMLRETAINPPHQDEAREEWKGCPIAFSDAKGWLYSLRAQQPRKHPMLADLNCNSVGQIGLGQGKGQWQIGSLTRCSKNVKKCGHPLM